MIRVPDNAGGGKGKCPRCLRRITVPKKSSVSAPKAPEPEIAALFEADSDDAPAEVAAGAFAPDDDSTSASFTESSPVDFLAGTSNRLGEFPVAAPRRPLPAESVSSRFKKKKGGGWLIPAGFGLLLCGVVGWFVWQQYQGVSLTGQLTAESAPSLELPPAEINSSMFKQSPDEMKAILTKLEHNPIPSRGTVMKLEIGASKRAVTVLVSPGTETCFYRVDIGSNPGLAEYRKTNSLHLEELREGEMEAACGEFAARYLQVLEKKADANSLNEFRNTMALPALVRGLGYQLIAVYRQTSYPCAYEDRDGGLYFLLPSGVHEFEVSGRKHSNGTVVFPGRFQVKVTGEMKVEVKETEEPAGGKKKKARKVEPLPETEKPDMKESMDEKSMN